MANSPTTTSSYAITKRTSLTMEKVAPKIVDNATQRTAVNAALKSKGGIVTTEFGEKQGRGQLVLKLMYGLNDNGKWHGSDFDTIDATVQDGFTECYYDAGFFTLPVIVSERQKERNQTPQGMESFVKETMIQAEKTCSERIEKTICGFSTAATTAAAGYQVLAPNQPMGLPQLVFPYEPTTGAGYMSNGNGVTSATAMRTWNTVGGITSDASTNTWWNNQVLDAGAVYATRPNVEDVFNYGSMLVATQNAKVNLWILSRLAYEKAQQRGWAKSSLALSTGKVGSQLLVTLGLPHMIGDDGALIVWSQYIINPPDKTGAGTYTETYGAAFGIDTDYTKLHVNPKANLRFTGLEPVRGDSNQLVEKGFYRWEGCLATQNRRSTIVIYEIGKAT